MVVERLPSHREGGGERTRLRTAVLIFGGMLGLRPRDVIAFAEAITERPWHHCGSREFELALAECVALAEVIGTRDGRTGPRFRGRVHLPANGGCRALCD